MAVSVAWRAGAVALPDASTVGRNAECCLLPSEREEPRDPALLSGPAASWASPGSDYVMYIVFSRNSEVLFRRYSLLVNCVLIKLWNSSFYVPKIGRVLGNKAEPGTVRLAGVSADLPFAWLWLDSKGSRLGHTPALFMITFQRSRYSKQINCPIFHIYHSH